MEVTYQPAELFALSEDGSPGGCTHPHAVGGSWLLAVRAVIALGLAPVLPAHSSLLSAVTRCLRGQDQLVQVGLGVGGRQAADLRRGRAAGDGNALREFNSWHLFGSQAEAFQARQIGWVGKFDVGHPGDQRAQRGAGVLRPQRHIFCQ